MKIEIEHNCFENKLTLGELKFEYKKNDGSLREARGTTKVDFIPEGLKPNGGSRSTKGTPYFDLDLNEWRSVSSHSKIYTTSESLSELPGIPSLTDEEVQYLLWNFSKLEDEWLCKFIELIREASLNDAYELMNGKFKNLIKTIKRVQENDKYSQELLDKWKKMVGYVEG
jgi:hypothetical protein